MLLTTRKITANARGPPKKGTKRCFAAERRKDKTSRSSLLGEAHLGEKSHPPFAEGRALLRSRKQSVDPGGRSTSIQGPERCLPPTRKPWRSPTLRRATRHGEIALLCSQPFTTKELLGAARRRFPFSRKSAPPLSGRESVASQPLSAKPYKTE